MDNCRRQFISLFIDNYHDFRRHLRFKAPSKILRLCSLVLALNDARISLEELDKCFDYIKQHTFWFSPFRFHMVPSAAFSLITEKPFDKAFNRIAYCSKVLKTAGFRPSLRLMTASMVLSAASSEGSELVLALRAHSVMRKMKNFHSAKRVSELLAPSILVASSDLPGKEMINLESSVFRGLDTRDPRQTRGLHFLLQILAYYPDTPESAAERCAAIYSKLVKMRFRSPSMFYGTLGFLALSGNDCDRAVFEAMDTMNLLKLGKCFSFFEKEQAFLLSSAMVAAVHLLSLQSSPGFPVRSVISAQVASCLL